MTTIWERTSAHGRTTARGALLLGASVAATALVAILAPAGHAGAAADECVEERIKDGQSRPEAIAACLRDAVDPTPTTRPQITAPGGGLDPDDGPVTTVSDDGTSTGLLIAVGLGGVVVGAGAALFAGRRRAPAALPSASPPAGSQAAPPGFAAPANLGAYAPPAASGGPAADGRTGGLVTTLIDLTDRVSSGALRAEIVAALAGAGVHALEPRQGDVFDANRMRGVGGQQAPDPTWIGRVATTERAGFHDGTTVLRLPEVIVYTAEG
jgi:hypothetical protein